MNGFRNEYDNERDDGVYVSLSIRGQQPHAERNGSSLAMTTTAIRSDHYERIDDRNNYQINVGRADNVVTPRRLLPLSSELCRH